MAQILIIPLAITSQNHTSGLSQKTAQYSTGELPERRVWLQQVNDALCF